MPQYFDAQPAVPSRPSTVTLSLPDGTVELETDRGVFSSGGIDPGTLELLRAGAPGGPATGSAPTGAHLLDLGCGYGPIAATLARRHPAATVWAVDVNERAIRLAAANASRLGLDNVRAVTSAGGVPAAVSFTSIWSNPPIRIGKEALHALLWRWLPRLAPDGVAWLVVHKHLGADSLATWLHAQGFAVERVSSKRGYRILRVTIPDPGAGPTASVAGTAAVAADEGTLR